MYYGILSHADLSAIARETRRVDENDAVYPYVEQMIREEVGKQEQAAACFEAASRRTIFQNLFEERLTDPVARRTAVSIALAAAKALVQGEKLPDTLQVCPEMTEEAYEQQLSELVDLLSRYNPTEQEINALARRLGTHNAAGITAEYTQKRVHALAKQAYAMCRLAKNGKLSDFSKHTTLSDAVQFVVMDDTVHQLQKLCTAGENAAAVGALLGWLLLLAACFAATVAVAASLAYLSAQSVPLGVGALLALMFVLFSDLEKTEKAFGRIEETVEVTAANVVSSLTVRAAALFLPDPDPEAIYL